MAILREDLEYSVRLMQDKDIPQVIDIDREAFPTQWPQPSYSSFKQELRNRLAHYIVAVKMNELFTETIAESEANKTLWNKLICLKEFLYRGQLQKAPLPPPQKEMIIGMAGYWLMVGEAHVTTIAVRNAYRKRGIGEYLLMKIIDMAVELKASMVTLEVRISNLQAQALYEKYGFNNAGTRKRYYADNGEDAYIMTAGAINSSSFQAHLKELKRVYAERWGKFVLQDSGGYHD